MTAEQRSKAVEKGGLGQTCLIIDPYGVSGLPIEQRATFNPLDMIDDADEEAGIMTGPLGLLADPVASGSSSSLSESWNTQKSRSPLMLPDELQQLLTREEGNQLVLIAGKFPMLLRRST